MAPGISSKMAFITRCVLLYLVLIQCASTVLGGAVFRLKFTWFKNSNERDWHGDCCDFICAGKCDHRFTICLDNKGGNNNFGSCAHGKHQTGEFKEKNNVYFNHDMAGVKNPIELSFAKWTGGIKLKVEAKDDDSGHSSHDLVDRLFQDITVTAARSLAQATWNTKVISGTRTATAKTQLSIQYMIYCEQNYFGSECAVFCEAVHEDGKGHYTCDPQTGRKVCLPGYEDPDNNCLRVADDCIGNHCQNGATCLDRYGHYTCRCNPGYLGSFCEIDITECSSSPCQNGGTCVDGVNMFSCLCAPGYVGTNCEHHICASTPCQNGGTCFVKNETTIGCECTIHYAGSLCSVYKCELLPCENGGTCENGTCICPSGYLGNQCDVDFCDITTCHNGGTCNRATLTCDCPIGFSGRYCELSLNECISNPCHNDGTCRDHDGYYTCDCLSMYSGVHCETEIIPEEEDTIVDPDDQVDTDVPDVTTVRGDTAPGENPDQHIGGPKDDKNVDGPVKDSDPNVATGTVISGWVFAVIVIGILFLIAVIIVTVLVLR